MLNRGLQSFSLQKPKGKGRIPMKSPSVPNLNSTLTGKSSSDQSTLGEWPLSNSKSPRLQPVTVSSTENSTNLSFIELYNEDGDDEDEEGNDDDRVGDREEDDRESGSASTTADPSPAVGPMKTSASELASSQYDRYGFKKQSSFITQEEYDEWWLDYSQYCVRRKRKWEILLEKSGLPTNNDCPDRYPSRSEKLKRYVRKGLPAEWRGNAWWYFARGQEKLNKNHGVYDSLLSKINGVKQKDKLQLRDLEVIERDLHRTFPDNIHFQKQPASQDEPIMIQSLRRVLTAFSIYNPKIGYCQSMNFLTGLLLLFMDEERAFWMLVIITSRYLPGVHNVNLEGVNIDQGVLMLCIKEYLPEFWSRIVPPEQTSSATKNEFLYKLPPITLCTAGWFMSCFVGIVPIETTLRIWDCLFYEESHILFKVSLSIIKLSEQDFPRHNHHHGHRSNNSREDEDMEVFQVIQSFPKKLLNPNDIFDKVIFKRRVALNSLNQEEVDRCRKYVASQRLKYKNYSEIMGNNSRGMSSAGRDSKMAEELINEALSSEVYGFKKSLTGVHWNNSIKEKVRQIRRR